MERNTELEQLELLEKNTKTKVTISSEFHKKDSEDPVRLYLKAIGQIPRLSAKEELEVAKKISSLDQKESKAAINSLIKSNLKLVVSIAKKFSISSCSLLDLIQEGNTGLMKAAERFHYKLGYKFSTYASWWIKQSIKKALSQKMRAIKIPPHALEQINSLKKVFDRLKKIHGRTPTEEELAKHMQNGASASEISLWKDHFVQGPVSLDSLYKGSPEEEDLGASFVLSDLPERSPEFQTQQKILKEELIRLISELNKKEKEILELRFGLNKEQRVYTFDEVSQIMGIEKSKVKSFESRALRNLRIRLKKQNLDFENFKELLFC